MREKVFTIEGINPVEFYGINDATLKILKNKFPKLKIIARGDKIKVVGDEEELLHFEMKFNFILDFLDKYGKLTEQDVEEIFDSGVVFKNSDENNPQQDDIIVFGNSGLVVKARTANQRKLVDCVRNNDMVFAIGPAGTGKTYTAVALAVRALKNKEVRRIILTRPAVEAGENLGFLPGDLKDKLDPYLQPLYDALYDMIPGEKLKTYIENRVIEIAPLAFMRGRTLDNAFVILDEAQNATNSQLKMFLTRMGPSAKFVVTGDLTQIDLPKQQSSGLKNAVEVLSNIDGIAVVNLTDNDVIRHKLVKSIINAYK